MFDCEPEVGTVSAVVSVSGYIAFFLHLRIYVYCTSFDHGISYDVYQIDEFLKTIERK